MTVWHIKQAARSFVPGAVIAYPTEAVYGLGCSPWDCMAVLRILQLKRRPPDKGLIVIANDIKQLTSLIEMPKDGYLSEIKRSWPGPVTWILPARSSTPGWLTGGRCSLAVRVPGHAIARSVCAEIGPLVSTSANTSGGIPARDPLRVRSYFGDQLDFIVPGEVDRHGSPSQIRDGITGAVIRQ